MLDHKQNRPEAKAPGRSMRERSNSDAPSDAGEMGGARAGFVKLADDDGWNSEPNHLVIHRIGSWLRDPKNSSIDQIGILAFKDFAVAFL